VPLLCVLLFLVVVLLLNDVLVLPCDVMVLVALIWCLSLVVGVRVTEVWALVCVVWSTSHCRSPSRCLRSLLFIFARRVTTAVRDAGLLHMVWPGRRLWPCLVFILGRWLKPFRPQAIFARRVTAAIRDAGLLYMVWPLRSLWPCLVFILGLFAFISVTTCGFLFAVLR
jgi:hypothetical protein